MEKPRTKELLTSMFTIDGEPYMLRYPKLGRARKQWLADRVVLHEMIKEGTVKIADNDRKSILYRYTPKQ